MYYLQITVLIVINCMLALGAYIPFSSGLMIMCLGSFMGIGAIVAAASHSVGGIPFPLAVIAGGIVAALCGAVVAYLCSQLAGFLLAVATIGMGELARVIVTNSDRLGGALGYKEAEIIPFNNYLLYLFATLGLLILAFYRFEKFSVRKALAAIKENESMAVTLGIDVSKHRFFSVTIGGFIAGIAGAFYIHNIGILDPKMFGFENSLLILMYPILGGSSSFVGPLAGALVLTLIPEVFRFSPELRMILYGLSLVLIVIFRPEGIIASNKFFRARSRA